jgi:hypothetical protein
MENQEVYLEDPSGDVSQTSKTPHTGEDFDIEGKKMI